jgi:hypothetical protein
MAPVISFQDKGRGKRRSDYHGLFLRADVSSTRRMLLLCGKESALFLSTVLPRSYT